MGLVTRNGDLLTVENLQTYFFTDAGVLRAVDGVSFRIASGETLGVVGESGCGKTVTALSILRLIPDPPGRIVGGQVIFEGTELLGLDADRMRKMRGSAISMIFQEPMTSLNPVFTVGDQIAEGVRLHQNLSRRAAWDRAVEMLRLVQIPDPDRRAREYPHQLSGGMRQRVMIAMALACGPRLLIADEPTTALDVTIQLQYLALLKEIQGRTNAAMLFITHDFGIVARMCDRVAVMYAGRIVESGPTRALFRAPRHPYTAALMASVPRMEAGVDRLPSIEGQPPLLHSLPVGCRFAPRCSFVDDRCLREYPPVVPVGPAHEAACWRVEPSASR